MPVRPRATRSAADPRLPHAGSADLAPRRGPLPRAGQPDVGRHRGPGPRRRDHARDRRRAPRRHAHPAADQHLARSPRRPVRPGRRRDQRCPAYDPVLLDLLGRVRPRRAVHASPSGRTTRPSPDSSASASSWSARHSPGQVVHLSQAEGEFTLNESPATPTNNHLLMISGGSGITPVMSQVRTLLRDGYDGRASRKVTFLHYARSARRTRSSPRSCSRIRWADNDVDVHLRHGDDVSRRVAGAGWCPAYRDTDTWACGPGADDGAGRRGVRRARPRLRTEFFKIPDRRRSTATTPRATSASPARATTAANTGASLLEQAEALGLTPGVRLPDGHLLLLRLHARPRAPSATCSPARSPPCPTRTSASASPPPSATAPSTSEPTRQSTMTTEGNHDMTHHRQVEAHHREPPRQQAHPRAARGVRRGDGRHPPADRRRPRRGGRGLHPRHRQEAAPARGRRPRAVVPPAGLAARRRRAQRLQDPGQHGDRPQRDARPVRLDGRPGPELADVRVGQRLPQRRSGSTPTTTSTTPSPTSSARTATSATASCGWTRTRSGTPTTWATRSTRCC